LEEKKYFLEQKSDTSFKVEYLVTEIEAAGQSKGWYSNPCEVL
jgi:hypothetical protein